MWAAMMSALSTAKRASFTKVAGGQKADGGGAKATGSKKGKKGGEEGEGAAVVSVPKLSLKKAGAESTAVKKGSKEKVREVREMDGEDSRGASPSGMRAGDGDGGGTEESRTRDHS